MNTDIAYVFTNAPYSFVKLEAGEEDRLLMIAKCVIHDAVYDQGRTIVLTASSHHRCLLLMAAIKNAVDEADIPKASFNIGNDRCICKVGDSRIVATPIADGSVVRGLRPLTLVIDAVPSVCKDVLEVVTRGLCVVESTASTASRMPAKPIYQVVIDDGCGLRVFGEYDEASRAVEVSEMLNCRDVRVVEKIERLVWSRGSEAV